MDPRICGSIHAQLFGRPAGPKARVLTAHVRLQPAALSKHAMHELQDCRQDILVGIHLIVGDVHIGIQLLALLSPQVVYGDQHVASLAALEQVHVAVGDSMRSFLLAPVAAQNLNLSAVTASQIPHELL